MGTVLIGGCSTPLDLWTSLKRKMGNPKMPKSSKQENPPEKIQPFDFRKIRVGLDGTIRTGGNGKSGGVLPARILDQADAQADALNLPTPKLPPQVKTADLTPEERERRLAKRAQRRATVARGARYALGIVSRLGDRAFERACQVVEECLDATVLVKTPTGVIEHPDNRIRLDAARLAIAYREGLPVARQVSIQGQLGGQEWDQIEDRVFGLSPLIEDRAPAIRQASARLLADKASGG